MLSPLSDESDELEDGLKHEGRVRSFAHVRGNWATYVYIPCEYTTPANHVCQVNPLIN